MTIELARSPLSVVPGPTALPPGFRFHPTDEELIIHYLRKRAAAAPCIASIIAEVDIYKFDPWDLPAKALFGEGEWYFFSPRDRKYPNGIRPNRAAGSGYWKATGTDKPIQATASQYVRGMIGVKKALVFYKGRPPKGIKTNWIMHEYRLADSTTAANSYRPPVRLKDSSITMRLDDWVLCRIYKKSNHQMSPMLTPPHYDSLSLDDTDTYVPARMPKPPSISDYLDDYSAVSELFDSLPETTPPSAAAGSSRFFITDSNEASLTQHYGSQKRQLEDCNNKMLHASKRLLSDASMPINNLSIYGQGQPSQNSI